MSTKKNSDEDYIKQEYTQVLEYESRLAFRNFLPSKWIVRDLIPDVAFDFEITIVEGKKVTNKILAVPWNTLKMR